MAQVYVPPMQVAPMQQESFLARNKVVIGVLVVLVILYVMNKDTVDAWVSAKLNPPAPTPLGGVTTPTNPASGPVAPGTPVVVNTPVNQPVAQVKVIQVTKDTSNQSMAGGENSDWRTFQIGEIRAYGASGNLLTANDFESAAYTAADGGYSASYPARNAIDGNPGSFTHTSGGAAVHQLTLTLKNAQTLTKVEVLNRADCCQSRLNGAVLQLKDSNNSVVKQQTLTAAGSQVLSV